MKTYTINDIVDYYNNNEEINTIELEKMIEAAGCVSDCHETFGLCHNKKCKAIINDYGQAVIESL